MGLTFALLLAAATPTRPPRTRVETIAEAREKETALAFTIFFWILLIGLVIAVLLAYV